MSDSALFVFEMWFMNHDSDPYYVRDWYGAKVIEVAAENRDEALDKARVVLGNPGSGRVWSFKIKHIRDIRIPTEEKK